MRESAAPLLLYDGLCPFCDRAVRFVLDRDRRGVVRFAPLQGPTARAVLERHPALRDADALLLVTREGEGGERVLAGPDAALAIASCLGGPWRAAAALRAVPPPLRRAAYALFARARHRVFGRYEECRVPPPELRGRFLP